jgi:hypothetical protein
MISIISCLGRGVYTGTATYTTYTTQNGKYSNSEYCDFPVIVDLENEKIILYLDNPYTFYLGNIIDTSLINENSISWITTDCNNNLGKLSMIVLEETNQIVLKIEMLNYKMAFIIDL